MGSKKEGIIDARSSIFSAMVKKMLGFGGQSFIENTFEKVKELKSLINETNSSALIEIDGGVNSNNAKKLIDCGANVLVAGSFVFKSENPTKTISELSSIIN